MTSSTLRTAVYVLQWEVYVTQLQRNHPYPLWGVEAPVSALPKGFNFKGAPTDPPRIPLSIVSTLPPADPFPLPASRQQERGVSESLSNVDLYQDR